MGKDTTIEKEDPNPNTGSQGLNEYELIEFFYIQCQPQARSFKLGTKPHPVAALRPIYAKQKKLVYKA